MMDDDNTPMSYDSDPPWVTRGDPDDIDQIPLASLLQLPVLRGLVSRLSSGGFVSPPRLIFAIEASSMPALADAVLRIMEAEVTTDAPICAGVPRTLGIIRLGTDLDLELVGLPAEDIFAPIWSLVLPGAVAVVHLACAETSALEACCEAASVKLLDAETLVPNVELDAPSKVAELLQATLQAVLAPPR